MRTSDIDVTESDRSYVNVDPDLETLRIDDERKEERSSGSSNNVAASSPTGRRSVSSVGAGSPTIVRTSVHPQSDASESSRQVGVATRFVVSTLCPTQPKSSSESISGQSDNLSQTSVVLPQQSSTTPSSSACSSSSASWCYPPSSLTSFIAPVVVSSPSLVSFSLISSSSAAAQTASSSSSSSVYSTPTPVPDGYSRVASCLHPAHTSESDVQRLISNCRQLNESPFYVAELSSTDAKRCLRGSSPGTFLIRDSAHPRHLYSLSVKTERGVTSIRTVYDHDGFRLDSEPDQAALMPSFDSVVELVNHYVDESRRPSSESVGGGGGGSRQRSSCVFVDRSGRRDLPVILATPYRPRPARLTHLCRLAINSRLTGRDPDRLCLVPSLRDYLKEHPFSV